MVRDGPIVLRAALALLIVLGLGSAPTGASEDAAWRALRAGGVVAILRHAFAPGTGDPPNFQLGDCSTQRNLSEAGRRQAAEIGARFRREGVLVADVRSSRWCRALDTATLAFPAVIVEPNAALDSFFGESQLSDTQTRRVREMVAAWAGRQSTLVLVTHQVNITALTGMVPAEGEAVVLRPSPGGFELVGRVRP